jgi:hypothetical protein
MKSANGKIGRDRGIYGRCLLRKLCSFETKDYGQRNISLETWPDGQMFRPHRTASYDTYGERWPGSITDQKPGIRVIHPVGEDMAR